MFFFLLCSPIQDFGAMALLRQYSLLNLPPSWKASLISSYGSLSFLTQQQQDFSSPFHRANFLGRSRGGGGGGGHLPPSTLPPIPPNPQSTLGHPPNSAIAVPRSPEAASAAQLPTPPPLSVAPSSLPPPPLPAPSQRPQTASRKTTNSSPSRTSPTNNKQRTYPCNECGKIFNAHYNLTRHMPVHTGK